jgi:elongation factor 1-gamma
LIAAKYNGVEVNIAPDFQMGVTNKTEAFLSKFPLGKVPAFETAEGPLYESNAIAFYVAGLKSDTQLLGKSKYDQALITQYMSLADNEIQPHAAAWLYPLMGYMPFNKAALTKAQEGIQRTLAALNSVLLKKTFLVGERITLADIAIAMTLLPLYKRVFSPEFRKPYTNVNRWFVTLINQAEFKAVIGEVKLAEVMEQYVAPKAEKKEEKKPEKKAEKKEEAEDLEAIAAAEEKPKEKNPLDLLPPSPLVLDAWKRFYSNNDTRPDAINWFWQNWDKEGYSMWRVEYKYNSELTLTFMSSNLIGGFYQRLERVRKYAFGSMLVTGEDNKNEITGFFIFRGQGIPKEVTEAADYESYNFTKVNSDDPATRTLFEDYIAWDGNLGGKKFVDGKIFK